LEEEDIPDADPDGVKNIVSQLKYSLREYWNL